MKYEWKKILRREKNVFKEGRKDGWGGVLSTVQRTVALKPVNKIIPKGQRPRQKVLPFGILPLSELKTPP
jgi:hypothetical protein